MAPKKYQEVLHRKYRHFTFDGTEFKINDSVFCIDRKYLNSGKRSKEEVFRYFIGIVTQFLNVCSEFQVPIIIKNVYVLTDDEIDCCRVGVKTKNGDFWNLIFLLDVKKLTCSCKATEQCFYFKFMHELFHAWTGLKYKNLEDEEIFTDLIAMIALKKTAQTPDELKIIQGIISNSRCNYIARSNAHEGKYSEMLQDPEKSLRKILGGTNANANIIL